MNSAHDIIPDVEGCDNNKKKMLWIVNQTWTARTLPVKDLTIHAYFSIPNFINQEEVIEHMEICSGTDPEREVLKLTCPYCQQTFETHDKIGKHIKIYILR